MHRNFTSRFIRKIEKYDKSSRYETLRKSCEDVVAFIRDEGVRSKTEGVESQPLESRRLTKSIPRWVARQREERKRKRKREKERGRPGGDQPAHARGARSATDLYSGQLHHPHSRTHMHCAALEGEMSMERRNERRRSSIFMKGCFRRMKTILAYIIPDARQKRGIEKSHGETWYSIAAVSVFLPSLRHAFATDLFGTFISVFTSKSTYVLTTEL